jgi:hypothetical protein
MTALTETQKLQGEINKQLSSSSDPTSLFLMSMDFTSLQGIVFKDNVKNIYIGGEKNRITTLENVIFPPNLKVLRINDSLLNSLHNVIFPNSLEELTVFRSQLTTLEGVTFPPNLNILGFNGNKITTLKGVVFPSTVYQLYLDDNQLTSFEDMKFPLSLIGLSIKGNPFVPDTISLLKNPSEVVIRDIVRTYPQTAQYFESQRELKELQYAKEELQYAKITNHIRSIATFLQPLIDDIKSKEEAKLSEGTPQLFITNTTNGKKYTIPFTTSQTVQSAIDYLEQNYLLSVMNNCVKIKLTRRSDNNVLDPLKTFADLNIQNEETLNAVPDNSTTAVQSSRGGRNKTKRRRKRKHSRSGK